MSDREKVYQLLDIVPDYKIGYVVAYLQGITEGEDAKPNAETLAAMKELEDGGVNVLIHLMNYGLVWRNNNVKSKRFWTVQERL